MSRLSARSEMQDFIDEQRRRRGMGSDDAFQFDLSPAREFVAPTTKEGAMEALKTGHLPQPTPVPYAEPVAMAQPSPQIAMPPAFPPPPQNPVVPMLPPPNRVPEALNAVFAPPAVPSATDTRQALAGPAALAMSNFAPAGPMGPDLQPHVSTIRNAFGDVLSQMQYGQNSDGTYAPGQLTQRRAGYDERGQWQNGIADGREMPRGDLTPMDMLRDAYERNLADRRGSPMGYGMNPNEAFKRAAIEAGLGNELAQRQAMLERERMEQEGRVQAAELARKHGIGSNVMKSTFEYGMSKGMSAPEAMKYAVEAERNALNPSSATTPSAPTPPMGVIDGLIAGIGKNPMNEQMQTDFLNAFSGAKLDDSGVEQFVRMMRRTPEGSATLNQLGSRVLSDDLAGKQKEMVTAPASFLGRAAATTFPMLSASGVGMPTYAGEVGFDYLPDVKAVAREGLSYLKNPLRGGMPEYDAVTKSGQRIPLSLGQSFRLYGQKSYNEQAAAQAEARHRLARYIFGN